MSVKKKIAIIDQDVAGEAAGVMSFMPSYRRVVFAADATEATELRSLFNNEFGIDLKQNYVTERIGKGLGVIVLSFADIDGKVGASPLVIEMNNANAVASEIRESRPAGSQDNPGGRIR